MIRWLCYSVGCIQGGLGSVWHSSVCWYNFETVTCVSLSAPMIRWRLLLLGMHTRASVKCTASSFTLARCGNSYICVILCPHDSLTSATLWDACNGAWEVYGVLPYVATTLKQLHVYHCLPPWFVDVCYSLACMQGRLKSVRRRTVRYHVVGSVTCVLLSAPMIRQRLLLSGMHARIHLRRIPLALNYPRLRFQWAYQYSQ